MSRYALHHEASQCIGCKACEVHCKTNKGLLVSGPSPSRLVITAPQNAAGLPVASFTFMPCFHCEDAWCLKACPTGAMQRRLSDGIVFVQASACVGCKACIIACPWGTPQWDPQTRKVVKCDYCMDRIDVGLKPACVTKCVTGCLSFGLAQENADHRRERFARQMAGLAT